MSRDWTIFKEKIPKLCEYVNETINILNSLESVDEKELFVEEMELLCYNLRSIYVMICEHELVSDIQFHRIEVFRLRIMEINRELQFLIAS